MNTDIEQKQNRQAEMQVRLMTGILQGLLALALLYTLYLAKTLLVPIVVALLLTLLLIPAVNFFRRYHIPRAISAILLMCSIAVPFTLLGMELAGPVQKWAQRLPELSATFTQQIDTMASAWSASPEEDQGDPSRAFFSHLFGGDEEAEEALESDSNAVTERITQGGVEIMVYLLAATPIFLAQYGVEAFAMVSALVYLVINGIEAQFVTPTVLGKHMRLNPLVLMIWLIIWAWLWGVVGVLLAVPLLVCIKLAASQLNVPGHWIRIIETRA